MGNQRATRCPMMAFGLSLVWTASLPAQPAPCDDEMIAQIRSLATLGALEPERVQSWIRCQVDQLIFEVTKVPADFTKFVGRLDAQFSNPANSPAFKTLLATQLGLVSATELPRPELHPMAGTAIARVLVNMEVVETLPGLLAGLKSKTPAVRYLAARGLNQLKPTLARDKARLAEVVSAIQSAGITEGDSVVVSHLYRALAYPTNVPDVLPAILAILDARLQARRSRTTSDGGEIEALEFFRSDGVLTALNAEQKNQLAQKLAVFLRLDAHRFAAPDVSSQEKLLIERTLEGLEAVMVLLTGKPAIIAEEFARGGTDSAVSTAVAQWVGDPSSNQQGILNAAPWNVPVGAP